MAPPDLQGAPADAAGPPPPRLGRRERKKQATRNAVHVAALQLAIRYGVENITIDQIAVEADISQRTFFNYFPTKEDALVVSIGAGAEALVAAFRARPRSESVLQAIRGSVVDVVSENTAVNKTYVDTLRVIQNSPSLTPHQLAIMAAHEHGLAEAIAERLAGEPDAVVDSLYPDLCAAASIAALRVVLRRWLTGWTGSHTPDLRCFLADVDRALQQLGEGLDHPGTP